jgi:hypothetical protein
MHLFVLRRILTAALLTAATALAPTTLVIDHIEKPSAN